MAAFAGPMVPSPIVSSLATFSAGTKAAGTQLCFTSEPSQDVAVGLRH